MQIIKDEEIKAELIHAFTDFTKLEATVTYFLVLLITYDPETIEPYYQELMAVLKHWNNKHPLVKAYQHFITGGMSFYKSNFTEAEKELLLALSAIDTNEYKETEGMIRTFLGANYRSMGDIDLAIENQLKAYRLTPRTGVYRTYRILCNYQLGETHVTIRDLKSALNYYQEAITEMDEHFNPGIYVRVYSGIAICQMHMGMHKESLQNINKAIDIPGIPVRMRSRALVDLGVIYSSQGRHSEAIAVMKESYELRKANNLIDASSTSLLYLAKEYMAIQQYDEALSCLNEAMKISESFNAKAKRIAALELLAQVYRHLKQYEKAVTYYEEFVQLRETEHAEQERRIFYFKNNYIEQQRKELDNKNQQLNSTLDELAAVKRSKRAMVYSVVTLIVLVLLTELFVDPLIDAYSNNNNHLSLALKALIALLLKPIDSFYESMLFDRAIKKREGQAISD